MRVASAALIGVSLLSLAACGGEDTPTAAATQPAATAASAAATTAPAEPAAGAPSDKDICEAAKKAGEASKKQLVEAVTKAAGNELKAADYKALLDPMAAQLTTAAGASETTVGKAAKAVAAETTKAAAAADPATAMEDANFEKAGKDLTEACKPTGVNPNF